MEEVTQPQEAETPDTGESQEPDWKAEALKFKAIAERREKKLTELKTSLEEKKVETETNKPNTEGLTREEVIFFAKGFEEDDYEVAKIIATQKKISVLEATKDDYFKALRDKKEQSRDDKKASLPPSRASGFTPSKPVAQMTRDEHQAWVTEQMNKAANG